MTRHRRSVPRNLTGAGVVIVTVLLALAPAAARAGAATRDAHGRFTAATIEARHASCALADTLSAPVVAVYAEMLETAARAVGVDVAPHTFLHWVDRIGRVAAHYCERGAVR